MKRYSWILSVVFLLFALLLSGCTTELEKSNQKIVLPVGYIPNVQFAPFYVGIDKGFYAEEGIDLSLSYGYEIDGVSLVGAGQYQFGVASGEQVILAQDKELPVIYIMNWYKHFPVGISVLESSGLKSVGDLLNKKIGVPALQGASYIALRAIMDAEGLSESNVSIEVIGFTQAEMLSTGKVDAVVVYLANEPVVLKSQGYQVKSFPVSESIEIVGNGLITNTTTIEEDPELVRAMVRATLRSIVYAADHPEETYEICKKFVENLDQDITSTQFAVLQESVKFWSTTGTSDEDAWKNTESVLRIMGLVSEETASDEYFTNDYLP